VLRCALACLALGCGRESKTKRGGEQLEVSELRYLAGVGQVNMPELAEDLGYLAPLKLRWVGAVLGGPEALQAISTGDVDFGSAATGSTIKMIIAGAPLQQVIASGGVDERSWGGYFVLDDSPLRDARDLIGKKISVNTLGAHAEFMIREYLTRGGLTRAEIPKVALVVIPPANGEQTLRQKRVDVASLSGVFRDRALERGGLRPLFRDRDLFGSFNSTTFAMHKRFVKDNPNATRKFVTATARAIEWARATPTEVVRERMRQIIGRRKRGEDPSLMRHWHSVGIKTRGGLLSDEDMRLWVDWLVQSGDLKPGQVSSLSSLYTSEFHPFRETPTAGAAPRAPALAAHRN